MPFEVIYGLLIPLAGTTAGAACVFLMKGELSRAIENSLDRDVEDFELNVASAGLDSPLKLKRQYKKNIGQDLSVTTFDSETFEGRLIDADDERIILKLPGRKNMHAEPVKLAYPDIKTAKIIIHF